MGAIRIETEYDRGIIYRIRIKGLDVSVKYRKNGYATILVELATYYAKEIRKTPTNRSNGTSGWRGKMH